MIQYKCPQCRETLESPDSLAGQEDICPNCGWKCTVPAGGAVIARPAAEPRYNPKLKFIVGGAVLVVLLAAGLVYYFMRGSAGGGSDKNPIIARRAMAVSMSQGTQTFRADSTDDCAMLLDLHELISQDDFNKIPRGKVYITFSDKRGEPFWTVTGTVTSPDETKEIVKACFVVPKDVRTFTLHLGDREPIEFTAPEKIEDEIRSDK